jgi:predicted amidohydrolase
MARALDNQVFWIASNQSGTFGSLRYVGNAKVVDPGGNVLANTLLGAGLAIAEIDVDATFRAMRGGMFHLRDRRPDVYGPIVEGDTDRVNGWREAAHA